jgi:putative endonuclease
VKKRRPPGSARSTRARGGEAERRAKWRYRLRGYRVLAPNAWVGGYELDLVLRRGRTLVFCEVKSKGGGGLGDPLEMVTAEKQRRITQAAAAWLAEHPEHAGLEVRFDVLGVSAGRVEHLRQAF